MAVSTNTGATSENRCATRSPLARAWRRAGYVTGVTGGVAAILGMFAAAGVAAPTCSDSEIIDVAVHGEHVVGDYVTGIGHDELSWPPAGQVGASVSGDGVVIAGGPGPGFHFVNGVAPGASFCVSQSSSPGFHEE